MSLYQRVSYSYPTLKGPKHSYPVGIYSESTWPRHSDTSEKKEGLGERAERLPGFAGAALLRS